MKQNPNIKKLEELKKSIPQNWINGSDIDFQEIIYMNFNNDIIPTIQISPEITNLYSDATTKNIVDYIILLHETSNTLTETYQELKELKVELNKLETRLLTATQSINKTNTKLFGKNFFFCLWQFVNLWLQKSKE